MSLIPLFLGGALFFIIKLANLGVRLSDTNVYWYTGLKIIEGKHLYKDIFFTNLPLFPYLSSFYLFISGKSIFFYYFTSVIEVLITTFFIFLTIKFVSKKQSIAIGSSLLYLFSFIILTTSDHQTGVFLASLFAVVGYYFFNRKNIFLSGVFMGITFSLKAYFAPIILTYFAYFLMKRSWGEFFSFLKGFVLIITLVIGPFLLFSREPFIAQTFGYSLHRSAGLSKTEIIRFFIVHDFILFALLIGNIINLRKNIFFFLFSVFSFLFLFLYKDLYYLYFNFMVPYLILSIPYIYTSIEKIRPRHLEGIFIGLVFIVGIVNFARYMQGFQNLGKISNLDKLTNTIKNESPHYLYGVDSLTPALAGLTHTPLLGNIIDTNENIFRSGLLDKKKLTSQALHEKTIIVTRGISYPQFEINEPLAETIFDKEKVNKKCKLLLTQSINAEGAVNQINLFTCY